MYLVIKDEPYGAVSRSSSRFFSILETFVLQQSLGALIFYSPVKFFIQG